MITKEKASSVLLMLLNPKFSFEHRLELLRQLCLSEGKESRRILEEILNAAASNNNKLCEKKIEELDKLISNIKNGPLRPAVFLEKVATDRAHVRFQDGSSAYLLIIDKNLGSKLQRGDEVLVDKEGRTVVSRGFDLLRSGQEVPWIRRVGKEQVEVDLGNDEKHLFDTSTTLVERFERNEVKPESLLLVSPRQKVAYGVVPEQNGENRYLFLDRSPVSDVIADRDIGNPPAYLEDLTDYIRTEMLDPDIRRCYRLPKTITLFLTGRSGTGKSLSIEAAIHLVVKTISEVTRVPMDKIPPRILRMRMSKVLSVWLGESDKRLDRFFDEVTQLYDEPFIAPDGKQYNLPVLAIGEEIDAFGRTRGMDHDGVFDRIQTTFLQRLDMTRSEFKDRAVIFIFTSNVPDLIDSAFLRRIGGTIHRFEGLNNRCSFQDVLEKHLNGLPFASNNGKHQQEHQEDIISKLTSWLFSQNGEEQRIVELSCAGSETIIKYRRSFLTGALVQRVVEQAAREACKAEILGLENPGLTLEALMEAFNDQIRSIVDNLSVRNINQYVDLPDGIRVTNLRRFEQPSSLPFELMRMS